MCDDHLSMCFIFTFDVLDIPFDNEERKYLRRIHLSCLFLEFLVGVWATSSTSQYDSTYTPSVLQETLLWKT